MSWVTKIGQVGKSEYITSNDSEDAFRRNDFPVQAVRRRRFFNFYALSTPAASLPHIVFGLEDSLGYLENLDLLSSSPSLNL